MVTGQPISGHVLFAHGAGAPMDSDFMNQAAQGFTALGLAVHRFEFAYMAQRRTDGKKRPPPRAEKLLDEFRAQIAALEDDGKPLFLAGKSMGGRLASMLLEESRAQACWVLGYPFHPLGKPEKLRIDHLQSLTKPVHIFQGCRDTMGTFSEVSEYPLCEQIKLHWLEDANHDLKPRKASGFTQQGHLEQVFITIAREFSL